MKIKKFEIERISFKSCKSFEESTAALEAAVGHPNMVDFLKGMEGAKTFADMENLTQKAVGEKGLMEFMRLDHGGILMKESGRNTPKIVRYLIGNPLIMKEMAKHIPDTGSYAPVTILVDERHDGVYLSYDRMASYLAPYGDTAALVIAKDLDSKVENILNMVSAE